MKKFEDYQLEKEIHEIATLMVELEIDPNAYLEQVMTEGIFKNMGDWWKKNVSAKNVVRLQSSYDQARQAMDNFTKNLLHLRKSGKVGSVESTGMIGSLNQIKQNLLAMKDQVAALDQDAKNQVAGMNYGDIAAMRGWSGQSNDGMAPVRAKFGDMKKSWDDWWKKRSAVPDDSFSDGSGI